MKNEDPIDTRWGALKSLSREHPPPDGLERRTVDALRAAGLVHAGSRRPRFRWAAAAVLAAALFGAGWVSGRALPAAGSGSAGSFMLLLWSGGAAAEGLPEAEQRRRVAEYSRWAEALARQGRLVSGEKLALEPRWLGGSRAARDETVQGYFVLDVEDYDAAVAVAESCPHLAYGGRIEVRRIERNAG
jgi:hypothetical protein